MSKAKLLNRNGVGLNLRLRYVDDVLKLRPRVSFFEIIAENLFADEVNLNKVIDISKIYPIVLHCVGMNIGGVDLISNAYIEKIRSLCDKLNPILVSDHLCMQKHGNFHHHDLLPIPLNKESVANCSARINSIQNALGREIAVENLSYYVEFKSSVYDEAEMLSEIVKNTKCKLIVDLNNYEINEKNFGIAFQKQWEFLDPNSIAEYHIAGGELIDGVWVDTHGGLPSERSLNFLKSIDATNKALVCFERDQKLPTFQKLMEVRQGIENTILGETKLDIESRVEIAI